ncbi:hypothetical protein Tco_0946440 [Tanacetum coccineum]
MTPYTTYPDIQGFIYEDDMNRNRLMRTDELHKFSDGILNHVRTALNDIATGLEMDYFPKRKWSKQDKQRARVMINAIDRKLRDRRLMRNLEKFVGGRPYGVLIPMIQPESEDLSRDIPLDSVEVFGIMKKGVKVRKREECRLRWSYYWNKPNKVIVMMSRYALKGLKNEKEF